MTLRVKILKHFDDREANNFSLRNWTSFAHRLWTFTDEFRGLIEYDNLEQKQKDKKLMSKVNELFNLYYHEGSDHMKSTIGKLQHEFEQVMDEQSVFIFQNLCTQFDHFISQASLATHAIVKQKFDDFCNRESITYDLR